MANITKARPFKKVYCDRPETFLMPLAAFKVWMYHYIREGQARESWCSLPTICESLDLDETTVKRARKWLKENGWLKQVGEKTSSSGKFKVPIMRVTRGTIPPKVQKAPMAKKAHRGANNNPTVVQKAPPTVVHKAPMDRGAKSTTEVDSETQVDTYRSISKEVDGFANTFLYAESPMPDLPEAGCLGKMQVPQVQKAPTVDSLPGLTGC